MSYIGSEVRQGKAVRTSFTASGGETSVNVTYTPGQLSVYLNGVKLVGGGDDYTASNGTSITGLSPALSSGDIVEFIALDTFTAADMVPASTGGTFTGSVAHSAGGSFGGTLTTVDILPAADDTSDLGSASKRWQNIYTTDLHLNNDRGDWTIIEEEEYLSIKNNKNGKMYKFVLEEIE